MKDGAARRVDDRRFGRLPSFFPKQSLNLLRRRLQRWLLAERTHNWREQLDRLPVNRLWQVDGPRSFSVDGDIVLDGGRSRRGPSGRARFVPLVPGIDFTRQRHFPALRGHVDGCGVKP